MRNGRRWAALALPAADVPSAGFVDTARNAHRASIDCLVWWDVTDGTSTSRFSPGRALTRAQIASFLADIVEQSGREVLPQNEGGPPAVAEPFQTRPAPLTAGTSPAWLALAWSAASPAIATPHLRRYRALSSRPCW